jgi:hypothetical protein
MGARFLVADGRRALAKVAANPPCVLYKSGQNACGKSGIYCGMASDFLCSSPLATYPDCITAEGTCPAGTTENSSWEACCTCPSNANSGVNVKYT